MSADALASRHGGPRIEALAHARSLLFVPGDRPERFAKAVASGADAVIVDLEDAVAPAAKPRARDAIAAGWAALRPAAAVPLLLRIQAASAPGFGEDLALAKTLDGLDGVVLPKAESAASLARLRSALGPAVALLPLIESADGWAALDALAAAAGVLRLAVGHLDFMVDTGIRCGPDEIELLPLRFAVVMATRRHRLAPPIDGVTTAIQDTATVSTDAQRAMRLGFGGKLCIHPAQVAAVHTAFTPTDEEIAQARRVLDAAAAAGDGAVQLDGRMIDAPVIAQARRVVARAG